MGKRVCCAHCGKQMRAHRHAHCPRKGCPWRWCSVYRNATEVDTRLVRVATGVVLPGDPYQHSTPPELT